MAEPSTAAAPGERVDVWAVPGQDRAARVLASAATQAVGHAWALLGPAGVGQEQLAGALTAALCCDHGEAGVACGACDTCRRALRGAHPALQTFAPTGSAHRVDDVRRTWLPAVYRSAPHWKVLRVVDADRLNLAAANAFLKALEEPPPHTVWLLDVADPDELPDTVLSRCRQLRLATPTTETLDAEARRLGVADPDDRRLAVRMARGSPRRLAHLADGGLERVRAHRDLLARLRREGQGAALLAWRDLQAEIDANVQAVKQQLRQEQADLAAAHGDEPPPVVAKELSERAGRREREARLEVLQAALDDLLAWVRDALVVQAGGDPGDAAHVDAPGALREDAAAMSASDLLWAADRIQRTRDDLERNVQAQLAIEALLLELAARQLTAASRRG
jgi:DNA polymerase-3 subunit delta'